MHRALGLALVLAPPLLTVEELLRWSVDPGDAGTRRELEAVAASGGRWTGYVLVGGLATLAFTAALLGMAVLLQRRAPRWAVAAAALALLTSLGQALHLAFEGVLTSGLAADPSEASAAARLVDQIEGDPLGGGSILLFIATSTLAPLLLVAALWATRLVPAWAAVPALLWPVVALVVGTGPLFAAAALLLLPLTVVVARSLAVRSGGAAVPAPVSSGSSAAAVPPAS
jgi:hypothetical protein